MMRSLRLQEACSLAQRCLRRAQQRGASRHTAAKVAASVLTRAAIDQGSSDNVTVVVVDLSRYTDLLSHTRWYCVHVPDACLYLVKCCVTGVRS